MLAQNHVGSLPPVHSFMSVSADNVVLTSVKAAEDSDETVLRFYEWAGKETDVKLELPPGVQSARETNLIEQSTGNLVLTGGSITVHTKPYEIKTVAVRFAPQP
jgi:alpha-mannosidase